MECENCKHKDNEEIPDCVIDGCCPEEFKQEIMKKAIEDSIDFLNSKEGCALDGSKRLCCIMTLKELKKELKL